MATCPICSAPSAGKRISWGGFELFDLCMECTSYLACLISPQADISAKRNAVRWAENEMEINRSKTYLANCIKSWKLGAENFIAEHSIPTPLQDGFSKAEPSESRDIFSHSIPVPDSAGDPEAMPFQVSTDPDNGTLSELEEICEKPQEEDMPAGSVPAELSGTELLCEILGTLRKIDSRMEKIEKELAGLKN